MGKLKVAILGASGFTGLELLRILALHPDAEVVEATSRQYKGTPVTGVYPSLKGFYDGLTFSDPAEYKDLKASFVFCALPHGASQEVVPDLINSGKKVVDLSADFRLKDPEVYRKWYGEHKAVGLIEKAVYGLPEVYRDRIKGATLVANPGCYPTGAVLALYPLLKEGLIDGAKPVIIDSKSGVSGAGRHLSYDTLYTEVADGFKAYKVGSHRHKPEIEEQLNRVSGKALDVTFTPHLLPASRGILTTLYASLKKTSKTEEVQGLYKRVYSGEPFVRVLDAGEFPNISKVRCSNFCDIGVFAEKDRVILISAIDNLVKGASGQAVQNMNIMAGFHERTALITPPVEI